MADTNWALAANGGVASSSSDFNASYAVSITNDGVRNGAATIGQFWNAAYGMPQWVQIAFAGTKTLHKIDVFHIQDGTIPVAVTRQLTFTQYGAKNFSLEYWNGSAWVLLESIVNNRDVWWTFVPASPISTDKIRVTITLSASGIDYARLVEIEAWTLDTPPARGAAVTQVVEEDLIGNGPRVAVVTQVALEEIIDPPPAARVTQAQIEYIFSQASMTGLTVVKKAKGKFNKHTAIGIQEIAGLGFRPKALIVWTTRQDSHGIVNGLYFTMGFTDGTTQVCTGQAHQDNVAIGDAMRVGNTAALLEFGTLAQAVENTCTLDAFNDDGFTLNWSAGTSDTPIIHFVALGGEELQAKVGSMALTGTNPQAVTGVGFQPNLLMTMVRGNAAATGQSLEDWTGHPSIGWAVSAAKQGVTCIAGTQANPARNYTYQRNDAFMAHLAGDDGRIFCHYALSSMDANGFTFAPLAGNTGGSVNGHYLALAGISADLGFITQPSATGEQVVTGLAFPPHTLFVQTGGFVANNTTRSAGAALSFGGAAGRSSLQQGSNWIADADNVSPTRCASRDSSTSLVCAGTPAASAPSTTMAADAKLARFTPTGFVVNWTTADATARQVIWVAIGTPQAIPADAAEDIRQDPFPGAFSPFLVGG